MAITDAERHRLHTKLDQVLGEEDAAVLISHLPPSGWSDVVRTRDLDQFAVHVDDRFDRVDDRFDRMDGSIDDRFDRVDDRFDRMDGRIDDRFAIVDDRFDRMDGRIDDRFAIVEERFDRVDDRFDIFEARFDASLERALREQTNRFLVYTAAIVTIAATLQQLLG